MLFLKALPPAQVGIPVRRLDKGLELPMRDEVARQRKRRQARVLGLLVDERPPVVELDPVDVGQAVRAEADAGPSRIARAATQPLWT